MSAANIETKRKRPLAGAAAKGAGPGRPKGSQNKTTKLLKEAILKAAEDSGSDGKGKQGTVGYLMMLAMKHPNAFSTLLGKVLPLQVTGANGGPMVFERIVREVVDPKK